MSLTERPRGTTAPPRERARTLRERVESEPPATEETIRALIALVDEHDGAPRADAGEALDAVGTRRPTRFEPVVGDLTALAGADDAEAAFIGLRSLAQLAGANERAVRGSLDAVDRHLDDADDRRRAAALSIVAEVGGERPDLVEGRINGIRTSLAHPEDAVSSAGALTAGRVLGADPSAAPDLFPSLLAATESDREARRRPAYWAVCNVALEHPDAVPDPKRAIERLAATTDRELELAEGTVGEAITALLDRLE